VFAWSGGSVLLRPEYLDSVGLFEESFFLYYEDTDLSWRGRAQGWRHAYEPRSVVRHLHAASSGTGTDVFRYYNERNRLLMLVRNAPAAMAARAALRHPLSTLSYLLHGDRAAARRLRRVRPPPARGPGRPTGAAATGHGARRRAHGVVRRSRVSTPSHTP
jgi:N-acetylglucosaminyl-diphospho-decaprenol L-rhamnosyltransferase